EGYVAEEVQAFWEAAREEAFRLHALFDDVWFASVLVSSPGAALPPTAAPAFLSGASLAQDWGEAPDVGEIHGRAAELETLVGWGVADGCRLVAIEGMGGTGKTILAARLANVLASNFARVYWRGLRNAPPCADWLAGAVLFLSGQQVLPAEG